MRNKPAIEKVYRYEDVQYHPGVDENDNPLPGPGRVSVYLITFKVTKTTPKGVWIANSGRRRFVLLGATRQYASPTKEEALKSFIRRKYRYIEILNSKKERAEKALSIGKQMARDEYGKEFDRYQERIADQKVEQFIFGE